MVLTFGKARAICRDEVPTPPPISTILAPSGRAFQSRAMFQQRYQAWQNDRKAKSILTFEQGILWLHLSDTVHGNSKSTATIAVLRTLIPFPERNVDIKDPVKRCAVGCVRHGSLRVFEVFQYECGGLVNIAETRDEYMRIVLA
jgi:hypothetical protein